MLTFAFKNSILNKSLMHSFELMQKGSEITQNNFFNPFVGLAKLSYTDHHYVWNKYIFSSFIYGLQNKMYSYIRNSLFFYLYNQIISM